MIHEDVQELRLNVWLDVYRCEDCEAKACIPRKVGQRDRVLPICPNPDCPSSPPPGPVGVVAPDPTECIDDRQIACPYCEQRYHASRVRTGGARLLRIACPDCEQPPGSPCSRSDA